MKGEGTMGIVATLRLPVQPDKVEQLKSFLKADLPDTRQFEGCQAVSVYQDEDVPASIVVWGTWDSRNHFEKYLAWRTARGDQQALGAMLAAPPAVSYLDPVDA
jgi:quinol monooxygenase YgiN